MAKKRGGGRPLLSLDGPSAETRYVREPSHQVTPEKLYERRWAMTLLANVLNRLRAEAADAGQFERLKSYLTGDSGAPSYLEVGRDLNMTEGAVKVAVHRLRGRYRELLREEIGRTLDNPAGIDAEIRDLFAAFR
jgi:RNA polymerase sigma-70 factor (ECF subfamily)